MAILEENRHTIVIIEHDPLRYEDAQEMAEYVSQAMSETSKEAAVLALCPRRIFLL